MKLLVINSTGPMGSSVVAAILEKFGYLNIPVRNYALHECMIGNSSFDEVKEKFNKIFIVHNNELLKGGANMVDRNSSLPHRMINSSLIHQDISNINTKDYSSLSELYGDLRNTYAKGLMYKDQKYTQGKHIELTTDFHKYIDEGILQLYQKEFKHVVFINLHRDFVGWIESMASQRFSSAKKRYLFVFRWLYHRYTDYENKIADCPGIHINFNELFLPDTHKLMEKMAEVLDEPVPNINWEAEKYDLHGKLADYKKAFSQADVDGRYLSGWTRAIIEHLSKKDKITRFHDSIVYIFYLFDLFRFFLKQNVIK